MAGLFDNLASDPLWNLWGLLGGGTGPAPMPAPDTGRAPTSSGLIGRYPPTVQSTGGPTPMFGLPSSPLAGPADSLFGVPGELGNPAAARGFNGAGLFGVPGELQSGGAGTPPPASLFGVPGELGSNNQFPSPQIPFLGAPYTRASQDYGTGEAQTPPGATPTAGGPAPMAQPSVLDRIMGGLSNNSNTLLALAGGFGGARTWGEGIGRGAQAAIPAGQLDQRQQAIAQATQALVRSGKVSPDMAMLIANNPEAMKAFVAQALPTYQHVTVTDVTGAQRPLVFNPTTGQYLGSDGKPITSGVGLQGVPNSPATGLPMQGQELLDYLEKNDPVTAAGIKAVIHGDINASGRNLQKILPLAALVEPGFTQQTYQTRLATAKSYTSGKQFQEIQAIGTVAGHLDDLTKAADKLDNTSFPILNQVKNWFNKNTGDPRVDQFNTVKQAVSNELSKAYRGGHVTEGDVREWQSNINTAQSPEQLKAVIGQLNDLLASKRMVLEEGYKTGMAGGPLPAEFRSESDRARKKFEAVADWAHGTGQQTAPQPQSNAPATRVINGKTYIQMNGKWYQQ